MNAPPMPKHETSPRHGPNLKHRMDAVSRLLHGEEAEELAGELGVSARERDQRRRESMVLSMLLSILERAYLMYSEPNDSFERNQWSAWAAYMKAWAGRGNFREELNRSEKQFDANFVKYLEGLGSEKATTLP